MTSNTLPYRFKNWIENDRSSSRTLGVAFFVIATVCGLLFGHTALMITLLVLSPVMAIIAFWYCTNPVSLMDGSGRWFWLLSRAMDYFAGFGAVTAILLRYVAIPWILGQ
jgi:hypothetical protein